MLTMIRNNPKSNDSPKWRPLQPTINNINLFKKPNYTTRSGKMVDVLYGRNQSSFFDKKITLVCTYFVTDKKHNRRPIRNKSFVENKNSSDYFYSDKHKLCTTAIEDDEKIDYITKLDDNIKNINSILENLGFVSTNDDEYTVYPSKIKCFNVNKQFNTRYGSNTYTSTNQENIKGSSDGYNQNGRYQKPISYDKIPEKHYYNKNYNSTGNSDGYNQNGRYQKPISYDKIPEKHYYNKNYNSTGNSDGYNQKERYQKSIPYENIPEKHYYNKNYSHYQKSITQNNTNLHQLIYTKKPNYYQQKPIPHKYWEMRYMLFSNFDRGIILDEESFYSVCPEILSYHIAKRCKNNVVVDPFCGAGGNIIQLAKMCKKVIAIDIDPEKIRLARHNAEICGVADKIEFMVGDFFLIYPTIKADVLFMSPPWGGPGYSIDKVYSLETMCKSHFGGGLEIFKLAKTVAPNIAFHIPKNTNLLECLWLAQDFGKVEIQQNIINGKLNSLTAFYGSFDWS